MMQPPQPITTFTLTPLELPKHWQQHYERLKDSCQYFGLQFPLTTIEEFKLLLQEKMDSLSTPTTFRVEISESGLIFHERPCFESEPLKLKTTELLRPFCNHKTLGYKDEEAYIEEISKEGFNELLRVTPDKLLSETAYRNIVFKLDNNQWVTPEPIISQCLPGLKLQQLIHAFKNTDFVIQYALCPLEWIEKQKITAAYTTNSVRGIEPVIQIDDLLLNPSEVEAVIYNLSN